MGIITASATHEMRNVLAIIKESAGLVEDLVAMVEREHAFPKKEKFLQTISKIVAQVERGAELSTQMNRFAHSPDTRVASINLEEALEHMVFLTRRLARAKGVTMEIVRGEESPCVVGDPLLVEMGIFGALDLFINLSAPGKTVRVRTSQIGDKGLVEISRESGEGEGNDGGQRMEELRGWRLLEEAAEGMSAHLDVDGSRTVISVLIPGTGEGK